MNNLTNLFSLSQRVYNYFDKNRENKFSCRNLIFSTTIFEFNIVIKPAFTAVIQSRV